ncbi:hypothetical protein [Halosimplex halobium]|uniref:hypothetical protein n=1 Tax=Halosimplex halobium TaxID=3396618 RepID=UPI003F55EE2D
MSGRGGRVPFTFPISVDSGDTERYRQQLPEDGRIERGIVFFPEGSRTDLRLTLVAGGEPINEAEATEESPDIPDHIVGSGTTYDFDFSVAVFEGQRIGVDADNVSSSSDLDGFVALTVDYELGGMEVA